MSGTGSDSGAKLRISEAPPRVAPLPTARANLARKANLPPPPGAPSRSPRSADLRANASKAPDRGPPPDTIPPPRSRQNRAGDEHARRAGTQAYAARNQSA